MSKDLLRTFAALILAFGLMAGSLGITAAQDFVDVDNEFDADQDADGGNADNDVNNDQEIENDQENDQDQSQDADQDQDVDQEGTNVGVQENDLESATGGDAGGDCEIFQDEIAENFDSDFDTDTADGDQTANAGADDTAACQHGDSTAGDSTGGDSNQANASDQDVDNENSATQDLGDQSQTNDMNNENQQAIANDLDADGGDADTEAQAVFVNEIVAVLIEILGSIIGGDGNTIGDTIDGDTGTDPVAETFTFDFDVDCTAADGVDGLVCDADGLILTCDLDIAALDATDCEITNGETFLVDCGLDTSGNVVCTDETTV